MNRRERHTRESRFTTRAKVLSVMFTVGIIALLAVRAPMHLGESAVLSTPPIMAQSNGEVGAFGSTLSRQEADAAARAAKQDDPPIPTF